MADLYIARAVDTSGQETRYHLRSGTVAKRSLA